MSGLTLHQKDLFMELFTQMNLSDASEMTKRIEHELGIAPPRAAVARVVEPDPVVEPEPTHFDVVLEAEVVDWVLGQVQLTDENKTFAEVMDNTA